MHFYNDEYLQLYMNEYTYKENIGQYTLLLLTWNQTKIRAEKHGPKSVVV